MKSKAKMLEFDTICGEGKNYTESIKMKTLMNTAMETIMKSSLCALAALLLAAPSLAETYVWNTNIASGNMSEAGSWLVDGTAAEAAPGENDTVLVSADTTLVSDLTVNAICVSGGTIDLNGHTLTVKSGVIRGSARWSASTIENGTLVSPEPIMYVDGINNSNVRWSCNIVVVGNADIEKPVLAAIPDQGHHRGRHPRCRRGGQGQAGDLDGHAYSRSHYRHI